MATALEQFLSVNMKPMDSPLEQGVEGIGLGMKLAEQQYNNQLRQQEIQLRKQEAQSNFLSKGISSLSALSKVKNPTQRKLLTGVTLNYLQQGGLEDPNGTIQSLLADQDTVQTIVQSLEQSGEKVKEVLSIAKLMELANEDPEVAFTKIAELKGKLAEAKAKGLQQYVLESSKQTGRESLEAQKFNQEQNKLAKIQLDKLSSQVNFPPSFVRRIAINKEGQPRSDSEQLGLLQAYSTSYFAPITQIQQQINKGIPGAKPADRALLQKKIAEVNANAFVNNEKADAAMEQVYSAWSNIRSTAKPSTAKSSDVAKKELDLLNNAQKIIKNQVSQETLTRIDYLNTIISSANDPEMRKNPFAGGTAVSAFGRVQDPRSSVRDQEYARIAKETGSKFETVKSAFEQAIQGNSLTENQWAAMNRAAAFYQQRVKKDIERKISAIKPRLNKAGITDNEIYAGIIEFVEPTYGIKGQQQTPVQSQAPKSAAPVSASSSQKTKGAPSESLVEKAKKQFPNDWKKRLDKLGYDTGGL